MHQAALLSVGALALLAIGCTHGQYGQTQRGEIAVNAKVLITEVGEGEYSFSYDAPYFDDKGNFDFSQQGPLYNRIKLSFTIADGSVSGLKFKMNGADAIWIVDKNNVGPDGSPQGPYQGRQFHDFNVSPDGLSLSLTDENDDGVRYRYGLRFDLGGEMVVDDPDGQNGGPGGHD